jgi:hypothetical protein
MWSGHEIMESWYAFKCDNVTPSLLFIHRCLFARGAIKPRIEDYRPGALGYVYLAAFSIPRE